MPITLVAKVGERLAIAGAHQRLRRQMEDDLRLRRADQLRRARRASRMSQKRLSQSASMRAASYRLGVGRRRQADAGHLGAQPIAATASARCP